MELNKFQTYSVLSNNGEKEELDEILQKIEDFKKCKTIDSVRKHLLDTYNVENDVLSFYIGSAKAVIVDDDKKLAIKFKVGNKRISYCYGKESK